MLAVAEDRLFVTEEGVGAHSRWVVPLGRIGDASGNRAVQVDSTVEFEKDVFRRAVGPGQNGERGSAFHHRNLHAVSEGDHVAGGVEAAIG